MCFQTKLKSSTKDKTSKITLPRGPVSERWQFLSRLMPGGLYPHAPAPRLGPSSWAGRDVHCCLLISQPFGVPRCFNYRGKRADDSGHMSPFHTNKSPRHPVQLYGAVTVPLKLMLSSLITIFHPSVSVLIQGTPAAAAVPGKYSI